MGPASAGRFRALAWAPALTVASFALPIAAGLAGTLAPAFGYLPTIGGTHASLGPWRELFASPGFATSVRLTLATGFASALLSAFLAFGFCAWASGRAWGPRAAAWLAPILATPHSAFAIGLAFVVAPSGWAVRAVSPWLTGFDVPPDVATVGHPSGAALVLGLVVKEVPYLVLMTTAALAQVRTHEHLALARSFGYGPREAWIRAVLPQIWRQVRLPVLAVLAYSLSVVDVALVLGPGNPPTLAVLAVRWFADADVRLWFPAAAAAALQLAVVAASIALFVALERIVARAGRRIVERGRRESPLSWLAAGAAATVATLCALACAAMAGMALWSVATQWRFPDAWPAGLSLDGWTRRLADIALPAWNTVAIGALATFVALALTLACLEAEQRQRRAGPPPALTLLYLPLIVPQVAFLFGAQVLLVRAGADGALVSVVWAHLIYVLPYLFLSLADPWRALDPRYARAAASLGASPARVFFAVKVPILAKPVAIACAVAFAVSAGQYLPTLFAGNGRVPTLTTEAVTLSAGADRRVIGAWAVMQALVPLAVYVAAVLLPSRAGAWRRRDTP
ncbi:Inner membrane ABC transporter permease protein YnjC [Burkholderiales bacterium]|nr:Inner membrane ABC transporter permease protein YnjC [Burkholderiales bacterium]